VESFVKTDGTGTIRADDGEVYFVHRRDIEGGPLTLEHGERVAFKVGISDGQPRAVSVRRI
jgi:cold shock CspA family protein